MHQAECKRNQRSFLTAGSSSRIVLSGTSDVGIGCLCRRWLHGNPGPSGIGVVIKHPDGVKIRIAKWIGRHDNNVAEYVALLEALQYAVELNAKKLHVYSDSEVVVRQMTGKYLCRSSRLYSLHWICRKLARSLEFSIAHVRREDNAEANRLANTAVRKRFRSTKPKALPMEKCV